ncbi:MAG: hypothetical protein VX764_09725 [Planctomycetota bacterium]|nr:hypothetical protein [Planctomycetota bacterium]
MIAQTRQRVLSVVCGIVFLMLLGGASPSIEADLRFEVGEEGWGSASHADVKAVLVSAAQALWKEAGSPKLPVIRVEPSGGPIVLHRRDADGAIRVRLAVEDRRWSQLAYQFSHEFAHILCGFDQAHPSQLWLEEAACEAASLFSLRRMAKSWSQKTDSSWSSYAPHLKSYSDDLIEKIRAELPSDFKAWFRSHQQRLQSHPDDRKQLRVVSLVWLELLEEDPRGWRALRYLNRGDRSADEDLPQLFRRWRKNCPKQDREQVDRVKELFIGIEKNSKSRIGAPVQN